jgi:hypothetical protein
MSLYTDGLDMETGMPHTTQFVEFYDREVTLPVAPEIGRLEPVKRTETYCIIQTPGDTTHRHDGPVRDIDKQRFPRHWLAYQMKKDNAGTLAMGTPLSQWNLEQPELFNQNQMVQMQAMGFQTVEQVAGMQDMQMQRVGMGAATLKVAAQNYLAGKNRTGERIELEKTQGKLAEMENQLRELMARLEAKQEPAEPFAVPTIVDQPSGMTPTQIRMAKARAARGKKVTGGEQHASPVGAASHG